MNNSVNFGAFADWISRSQAYGSIIYLKDPTPTPIPPSGSKFQRNGTKWLYNPSNGKWQVIPN